MTSPNDIPPHPNVLVVDDLEENIVLLKHLLEPKGYRIHQALGGQEALDLVEQAPPDVILLDLVMPGMDGFEVCERLKDNPATRHIPVIITTGLSEHEANLRAINVGADDFVLRPIEPMLLEARIRSGVRAKVMQDQIISYQKRLEDSNLLLERRVRERTSQLELTQRVTSFSLARLAESRDTETGMHLERMRRYVRELALEFQSWPKYKTRIGDGFIEQLYHSSPLHDIGKVGIPDKILLKPGKLTPQEFEIMKTHSTIGGETLKAADEEAGSDSFLAMGRDIAYYHHEKWDGSGYPEGRAGENIPLVARIVALGDVYDALRSKRPYKEPMPHSKARSIILEDRGRYFDPDVVDAFIARENEVLAIAEEFQDESELSPIARLAAIVDNASGEQTSTA